MDPKDSRKLPETSRSGDRRAAGLEVGVEDKKGVPSSRGLGGEEEGLDMTCHLGREVYGGGGVTGRD